MEITIWTKLVALLAVMSLISLMLLGTSENSLYDFRRPSFFPNKLLVVTNEQQVISNEVLATQDGPVQVVKITNKRISNKTTLLPLLEPLVLHPMQQQHLQPVAPVVLDHHLPSLIKWQDCGTEDSIIKYNSINLQPFPLHWGQTTKVTANFTIFNNLTSDIESDFKIGPLPLTKNMPIPCIGSFGSCNENLCTVLSSDIFCQFITSSTKNAKCHCPIGPSTYSIRDFIFDVPQIPPILNYFASGDYKILWRWTKKGQPHVILGCIRGVISFK